MKKNMVYCLSLLVALIIVIASCKTLKTIYKTPKTTYTDALPADASMILSFDVKSILKKAELSEGKNTDLKRKAIDFLKARMSSPASFAFIEKVIQKPEESGINIAAPFYIAFTEITKDPVILAKVNNLNKLKSFWNVMASERITTPIEKRENYNYGTFAGNNSAICAFNESVLLFGANNLAEMDKLMSQKKTERGAFNPTFVKLQERKGEIKYYLNLKTLAKVNFMGTPLNEDMKGKFDMELFFFMSFEKGKVCMQADMVTKNENLKQLFEKSAKAIGKQKSVFTNKIPSSVFAYIGFNINGEEYYQYLKDITTTYSTMFAGLAPYFEAGKELFSWIKGDVAVALLDVSSKGPAVCAYAEVVDASLLKKAVDNLQKNNLIADNEAIVELKENDYIYQQGKIKLHIGVIDKYLYVTNSEEAYQTIIKGTPPSGKTLKDTKFASKIKGTSQYMFISVDNILQSPLGLGVGAKLSKPLSRISYLEIVGSDKHTYGGELNLIMKDEKTNALAQIMSLIRELSGM
ncbi:hypothetical protein EZS27_028444 [termite gut metagenome]|uniref:DUF4836 family protein n=1 Tax=termite gut metagenome TaxID=433724 RepID=A0A5J4QLY8_9ZZZZ